MSPEQGAARWDLVGSASDIFSLGAILYAILTGCAPYQADVHGEILERVTRCEFRKPRQVKLLVPRALEAICLKAMAPKPADRYATALELAADVKCWLADEPVKSWREPLALRARRWARRHRTIVTSAAAVLVLGLVGVASFAAVLASKNLELDRQRKRAEERHALAISAVQKFRDTVQTNRGLKNHPELERLRKDLLKEPLEFFRKLRDQLEADRDARPESLAKLAEANFQLAKTTADIASVADAVQSYSESIVIRERLAQQFPMVPEYQQDLARSYSNLGLVRRDIGQPDEALKSFRKALAIQQRLALTNAAVAAYRRDLALSHINIGGVLHDTGRPVEALESYRNALEILNRFADDDTSASEYQDRLAAAEQDLGLQLYEMGHAADGLEPLRRSQVIRERLARDHPALPGYLADLARSHLIIALLFHDTGDRVASLESLRRARAIWERLVREHPTFSEYLWGLAQCQNDIGGILQEMGRTAEATESLQSALKIRGQLARDNTSIHAYQSDLAVTLHNIAEIEMSLGRWEEARQHLEQAIERHRTALAAMPRQPFYLKVFTLHLLNLVKVHQALKQPAEAIRAGRELAKLARGNPIDLYNAARALAQTVPLTRDDRQNGLATEAMQALEQAVVTGWNDAGTTSRDPDLAPLHRRDDFRRLVAKLFDRGFPADPFAP
jgi:tetratricopeptide (TPR) repeat protein